MILAYYGKILPDPIWVSFPSPGHYADYGKYISREYTYGEFAFARESSWDLDNCGIAVGKGGWGHVWQNGVSGVLSNLQDYLVRHGLDVSFAHYDERSAKDIVQLEIDQGRPLIARTRLTAFGHYVVITGYEIDNRGDFWYKVNDPFGHQPYHEGCWGEYGESQPVSYSYAQMGLGEPSRGLMTISGALRGDLNGD
jgi:hypothetical protein